MFCFVCGLAGGWGKFRKFEVFGVATMGFMEVRHLMNVFGKEYFCLGLFGCLKA